MPDLPLAVFALILGGTLCGLCARPRRHAIALVCVGAAVVALSAYYLGATTATPPWLGWLIPA